MSFATAKAAPVGITGNPKRRETVRTRSRVSTTKTASQTPGRGRVIPSPLRPLARFGSSYTYVMPVPPSLNNIYENKRGGGRRKSDDYKAWCLEADLELARQKPVRFKDRVDISIYVAEQKNSDIDNRLKPILDSLKRCGVIKNDNSKYVRSVRGAWSPEEKSCRVILYHAPADYSA